jgi:hypothetical protein
MPTQLVFTTPKKKQRARTKLRTIASPTTFSAITKNLIRNFGSDNPPPDLADLVIPDFSQQVQLPNDFSLEERKSVIKEMTSRFATTMASEKARALAPKMPTISFKDYETQHVNDIKPIEVPIKDNANSFIAGLFQFHHAPQQFRGWESATIITQYQATSNNNGSEAENDTSDANKWKETKIDLFKDFEQIDIDDLKAWAETVWSDSNSILESQDGQSTTYARKVFSEFLFGSMAPELQKAIQNAIPIARHWNDGPYVWATMIHRFFPSAVVLRTTILDKMKNATLAEHNNDLSAYCASLLDMNAVIDTASHSEELVKAFLAQTSTHSSELIRNHFNHLGLQFFMNKESRKSFETFLDSADRLHTITTSPALPFAATTQTTTKNEQNIAALAGIVKGQSGHMKKLVSAISQIDNKLKQSSSGPKQGKGSGRRMPPWQNEEPTNTSEVKMFNNKPWFWCATCNHWSPTHSTDGTTHDGKTIAKHRTFPSNKRKGDKQSQSSTNKKKYSSGSSPAIDSLKSRKAKLNNDENSSILSLIAKAAAGEQ